MPCTQLPKKAVAHLSTVARWLMLLLLLMPALTTRAAPAVPTTNMIGHWGQRRLYLSGTTP
jgi:hypothetical protein